jgi:hypothetical protein
MWFALLAPGLKYVWRTVVGRNSIMDLALRNRFCAAAAPKFDLFI